MPLLVERERHRRANHLRGVLIGFDHERLDGLGIAGARHAFGRGSTKVGILVGEP